jgi:hypothetical protein
VLTLLNPPIELPDGISARGTFINLIQAYKRLMIVFCHCVCYQSSELVVGTNRSI